MRRYSSVADPEFLQRSNIFAQGLPEDLRTALNYFRLAEPDGACLVSGFPVSHDKIGDTPTHWSLAPGEKMTLREEVFLMLCGSLLGDTFGWASQQGGRLVHEVVPIQGHENMQINSASNSALLWHTEDAFHPCRADYIGLMCLRNPERIETMLANVRDAEIDQDTKWILFQPRFILKPDASHLPSNSGSSATEDAEQANLAARGHTRIKQMLRFPEKVSILFGSPDSPYIRLDSAEVDRGIDDLDAMNALKSLMKEIDRCLYGIPLRPGEMLFLDNYVTVHGRNSFQAKFDGSDRWLKRINITRNLRRSRDARLSEAGRIIY